MFYISFSVFLNHFLRDFLDDLEVLFDDLEFFDELLFDFAFESFLLFLDFVAVAVLPGILRSSPG